MYRILAICILVFTCILVIVPRRLSMTCPPPEIMYVKVPQSFEEEQKNPVKVSEIFKDMFEKSSVFG